MSGKIDISKLNVPPEKHELATAKYFAELGYDIEFIPPSNSPKIHTPDIKMANSEWEMKCPKGKSKRTIENNFRKAAQQSKNIIFDLRRVQLPEDKCITKIEKEFEINRSLKKLMVITKSGELKMYSRN